jgi:hypothetical protein
VSDDDASPYPETTTREMASSQLWMNDGDHEADALLDHPKRSTAPADQAGAGGKIKAAARYV